MSKRIVKEFFPPSWIALNREANKHPQLLEDLRKEEGIDPTNFIQVLECVATYCEVIVDGEYLPADLDKLCGILTRKLYEKRTIIVMPTSPLVQ